MCNISSTVKATSSPHVKIAAFYAELCISFSQLYSPRFSAMPEHKARKRPGPISTSPFRPASLSTKVPKHANMEESLEVSTFLASIKPG